MKYNHRFLVLDTETGGLLSKGKEATIDIALTEIGVVVVDSESLEIINEHSWLIKPYDDGLIYSAGAEKASGISKKMCEDNGIELELAYTSFVKVLKDNKIGRNAPILIIQNNLFDMPFFNNLFAVFNDDFENYYDRVEDTLDWARLKFIEKPDFKLGSIAEYLNLDHVEAHRALPDARITARVWISFVKSLRSLNELPTQENKEKFREKFKF
jgi:DNA polymerase-3 subunit alpha (Gram-positive type)